MTPQNTLTNQGFTQRGGTLLINKQEILKYLLVVMTGGKVQKQGMQG